jgi:hypothetical protein
VVGVGEQIFKNVQNLGFEVAGEVVVTPSLATSFCTSGSGGDRG